MVISDLSYLEPISDSSKIQGSDGYDWKSYVPKDWSFSYGGGSGENAASAYQSGIAISGPGIGNIAIALNIAIITQVNL